MSSIFLPLIFLPIRHLVATLADSISAHGKAGWTREKVLSRIARAGPSLVAMDLIKALVSSGYSVRNASRLAVWQNRVMTQCFGNPIRGKQPNRSFLTM